MPKVTGPLFSINASGSVAGLLTFKNTAHGFVAQRTPHGHDSATTWQLIERQSMRDAAAAWKTLDPALKTIWGANALPSIRSAWMSFFLEWKAQQITPGNLPLIPSQYIGVPPSP